MKKFLCNIIVGALLIINGQVFAQEAEGVEGTKEKVLCDDATLSGPIDNETVSSFISVVRPCIQKNESIRILISTHGGAVGDALGIYDAVGYYGDRKNVTTVAFDTVGSAGVIVYLAGDQREITPNAKIFLHPVSMSDPDGNMRRDDLNLRLKLLDMDSVMYEKIVSERTKLTQGQVREFMARGTVLDAEEAVKYGFAQKIVGK